VLVERKSLAGIVLNTTVFRIEKVLLIPLGADPAWRRSATAGSAPSGTTTPQGGNSPREHYAAAVPNAAVATDESGREALEHGAHLHALEDLLDCGFFYFSFELDLTVTLQKTVKCAAAMPWWRDMPLWDRAERRFLWNQHMMRPLEAVSAYAFLLPIMYGFVQVTALLSVSDSASRSQSLGCSRLVHHVCTVYADRLLAVASARAAGVRARQRRIRSVHVCYPANASRGRLAL
jgi:hypothetical protein